MKEVYTIIESATEDAITVSYDGKEASIIMQQYSDEKYNEFFTALEKWELLLIDESWEEEGIETGDYSSASSNSRKRLPLDPNKVLVKNGEAVGVVVGHRHYPGWKTRDGVVLMFFDGTSIGRTEYENDYVWGDYPSETTYYHDHYIYKLVEKEL